MEKFGLDNINERIRLLLIFLDVSQREFAKSIGTDGGSISKILSGKSNPTTAICKSIIFQYSVNPEWLYYGKGEMISEGLDKAKVTLISKIKNLDKNEIDIVDDFVEYILKTQKKLKDLEQ